MSILHIIIIAICFSVMDILTHNFKGSIFWSLREQFWNPASSYLNKYINRDKEQGRKYPKFLSGFTDSFSDAWHIVKLILIITIIASSSNSIKEFFIKLIIYGATFSLFYSKILLK